MWIFGLESVICSDSRVINAYKDVCTLVVDDCDALNKHMDCEMKRRGSCSGGRGREKKCATPIIASTPSKEGDLQKAL
jgi:hypothetical protein